MFLSLLLALLAMLAPWSTLGLEWRPNFLLLAVLFWVIRAPKLCDVGMAWLAGLLMDLISGDALGQHAFSYTVVISLVLPYRHRLELMHAFQETFFVLLLLWLEQLISCSVRWLLEGHWVAGHYFLPSITGATLWLLLIILRIRANASL